MKEKREDSESSGGKSGVNKVPDNMLCSYSRENQLGLKQKKGDPSRDASG